MTGNRRYHLYLAALCLLSALTACAGSTRTLTKEELRETVSRAGMATSSEKQEEARQSVSLALAYFDEGGYEKCGELFLRASDLYAALGLKKDEKRALLAAARGASQMQPKGGVSFCHGEIQDPAG